MIAHIASDYGRLYLNARSADRSEVYQDVQIFCDMTLEETGERGSGVLELGKFYDGPDAAEPHRRDPPPAFPREQPRRPLPRR